MSASSETVLVSGAATGIGRATVARLVADRRHVTGIGRRADRLQDLVRAHGADAVSVVAADLIEAVSDLVQRLAGLSRCHYVNQDQSIPKAVLIHRSVDESWSRATGGCACWRATDLALAVRR